MTTGQQWQPITAARLEAIEAAETLDTALRTSSPDRMEKAAVAAQAAAEHLADIIRETAHTVREMTGKLPRTN
jgi:hypothetical protein